MQVFIQCHGSGNLWLCLWSRCVAMGAAMFDMVEWAQRCSSALFTLSRSAVFTEVSPTKWETSSIHCSGQSSTATLYCNMSLVRKLVLTRVELSRPIIMRVWQWTLTHDEANTNLHSRTLCSLLLSSFGRLEVSHRTHCVVRVFVHEFSFCWNDVAGSFFFFFFFFSFLFLPANLEPVLHGRFRIQT